MNFSNAIKIYKKAIGFIGRINTIVIMTLIYFLIMPIFALISAIGKKKMPVNSSWQAKEKPLPNSHEYQF